jgi:ATP-dependent exoDNAse (exonuclease V) beta subunit
LNIDDDEDLIDAINGVIRYARLRAKDYARGTITTHLEGKESASIEEALRRVIEDELDVKYLTYARNPRAPVFIDTVYTAKGLEFDKVYIANYARKGSKVPRDKWGARLFYVALTRSKGSVVIMTSNNKDDSEWFSTDKIKALGRKLGAEVVEG